MSINCGHCKGHHATVADVRACSEYSTGNLLTRTANTSGEPKATDKQMSFLKALLEERGLDSQRSEWTKREASAEIERLLHMPAKTKQSTSLPDVPAGRYAVEDNGSLKFYKVDRPTEGRWAGRTFVKVQASDREYPVKGGAAARVLSLIARDPKAAMLRYGREIGSCGHCGRTLTNEDSRAAGIGPICAGKMGW